MPEELFIAFKVYGEAQTAGSKRSWVPLHPKLRLPYWSGSKTCRSCRGESSTERCDDCTPRIIVNTVDDNPKSNEWKKHVHATARKAMKAAGLEVIDKDTEGTTLLTPLRVVARFYKVRPDTHYRTGKFSDLLKDNAPAFPTPKPDVLKLMRALEDGMTGAVYKDDCQIVTQTPGKFFGKENRVDVEIYILK